MTRFGDWNARNRELLSETQRLGGNPYHRTYLEATMPTPTWKKEFALLWGNVLDELQEQGVLVIPSGNKVSAVLLAFIEHVHRHGQINILRQLIDELSPVSKLLSSAYALDLIQARKEELEANVHL
jgi:hypothetical protein